MKKYAVITIVAVWIILSLVGGMIGFWATLQRLSGGGPSAPMMRWIGFGFGLLGFLFQLFFIFLLVALAMRLLFGKQKGVPALFEMWHKQAHEQPAAERQETHKH